MINEGLNVDVQEKFGRHLLAPVKRRSVLKFCAVFAVLLPADRRGFAASDESDVTVHFETRSAANQDGRDPIHMYVHGIKDEFGRHAILGGAAVVLHSRFRDVRVARNAYQIAQQWFIDGQAWKDSNIEPHPTVGPKEMLAEQLSILRLPKSAMDEEDEGPPFPPIHIYGFYEENDVWGRGPLNIVKVIWEKGNTWRRKGEFKVNVNLFHLGSQVDDGKSPLKWASVIAHEMLHNLGHRHGPDSGPQDYSNKLQINAFHRALFCNGSYDGGRLKLFFG
jgi:hypothetical protein